MSNRESFTAAYEVRCAQLAALVIDKQRELEKAKANVDTLSERVATGDGHIDDVRDEQRLVERLEIELRGCHLMHDREVRRGNDPEFLKLLEVADDALSLCDDNAFNRRFESELVPKLRDIANQLGAVFASTQKLGQECREPWLNAKRAQARLGSVRVIPDEAGLNPAPVAINAHFRSMFISAIIDGAGEFSSEIKWALDI